MLDLTDFWNKPPFSFDKQEKEVILTKRLGELTRHHYDNCSAYRGVLDGLGFQVDRIDRYQNIPFLPVSLFKHLNLLSIHNQNIFKTMTSSGTSGQAVSKIYLDKTTASNQQKVLIKIVTDFTGSSRMPLLIIDSPSVLSDRSNFSARGAGILGFSIFGTDRTYALNNDMSVNFGAIEEFLEKHQGRNILLFGFTFMIWQHFYKEMAMRDTQIDLSNGVLIHGGGWKKLLSEAVPPPEFKRRLNDTFRLQHIYDYYGMVEQTGCIYMECEQGHLHASIFSDVIIRRAHDFLPCEIGESGIIQVVSILPESYPGHSLLTEDEGIVLGEDDCKCGRKGKYFTIIGRLKNAELRGCSDTYAATF